MSRHLVIRGDARRIPLPDESVHCVVTSPPYWQLRSYGVGTDNGEIGLEASPDAYVAAMVEVFREVRRVLRSDGVCWLNLGDSYNSSSQYNHGKGGAMEHRHLAPENGWAGHKPLTPGLKSKDLYGIPWRVALALQNDGWWLRSDIVWSKPSPMPESVTDRPTRAHEYIFLLTKSARYFYDAEAVREKQTTPLHARGGISHNGLLSGPMERLKADGSSASQYADHDRVWGNPAGRNLRSVWTIPSEAFPGSHFATFPRELARRCILAGTSERGACPRCGKAWVRVTDVERWSERPNSRPFGTRGNQPSLCASNGQPQQGGRMTASTTLGFRAACKCPDHEPVPCRVYDPFGGAGTVALVAEGLGRIGLMTELSPDYCRMALERIRRPHKPHQRRDEPLPLFPELTE